MRILAIANHLGSRGGLERTQLTNCRGLAARGHRLDVIYVSSGDFAQEWRSFAESMVVTSGTLPRRRAPLSSTLSVARALGAARRLRPDVVYVYRYWDIPFAAAVASTTRARLVYHLCLPPPKRVPIWLRQALRRVDATLAVSRDTADRWTVSNATGLRADKLSVVLTGIDLSLYVPGTSEGRASTRSALGLHEGDFVVIYAGRIDREKGVDVLVRACRKIAREIPDLQLVVVGGPSLGAAPEDSERYRAELEHLSEGVPVAWLGTRRNVLDLIQAADVAVSPSLWPEPLSRSVLEPLACGIPVVASRVGGNPEILRGDLAELLVDPGDAEMTADRLMSVRDWRRSDPELSSRCRAEIEERFDLDREIDEIEAAMLASLHR